MFSPKVQGTLVLDDLYRDEALDFFVLFSSISAVVAPAGQVDYVAANAFLNAYAEARRGTSSTYTVAIGWGVWSELGMAARMLPAATGPLVGEEWEARHALFERVLRSPDGRLVLTGSWSPEALWLLNEHRRGDGKALIPGSGYFELARIALDEADVQGPFELRDLFFFRPLQVDDGQQQAVRLHLTPEAGGFLFELQSLAGGPESWTTHGQAHIDLRGFEAVRPLDLKSLRERCPRAKSRETEAGLGTGQERHMQFGQRWQVLRSVRDTKGLRQPLHQPPGALHPPIPPFLPPTRSTPAPS